MELATAFDDPALARQFVQGMMVVSLADGPTTEAQANLMSSYARALGVDEPAMSDGWDHWAWVEKPLAQARAELNITPLET